MPIFVPFAAAAAPWIIRMAVKYAWGPLVVAFGYLLKTRMGFIILTAFTWLGINFTTIKLVIEPAITLLQGVTENVGTGGTSAFAAAAAGYMGIMQMDRAVTMIISAVATKHLVTQGRLFLFKRGVGA